MALEWLLNCFGYGVREYNEIVSKGIGIERIED